MFVKIIKLIQYYNKHGFKITYCSMDFFLIMALDTSNYTMDFSLISPCVYSLFCLKTEFDNKFKKFGITIITLEVSFANKNYYTVYVTKS